MIKVNLLKSMGATTAAPGVDSVSSDYVVSSGSQKQGAMRLALIVAFPLALYIYDAISNSAIQTELDNVRSQLAQVQAEKAKFGDTGVRMEALSKDKKEMDQKVDAIRDVARNRLREVKSYDALQSLMPARTWLNKVMIKDNVVKAFGYTNADEGIAELIRGLEGSSFFSRVDPKSTSSEKIGNVTLKKFELEFQVGKVQE